MSDSVVFGVKNARYDWKWRREALRLGGVLHVEFKDDGSVADILASQTKTSVKHVIAWIAPSEFLVVLSPGFEFDDGDVETLRSASGGQFASAEIHAALTEAAKDARLEHFYKTREREGTTAHRLYSVARRLDLVRRLDDNGVAKQVWSHHFPLTQYLLLTCFDLLGQPDQWCDFGGWSRSSDTAAERASVLSAITETPGSDRWLAAAYDAYNEKYGVKRSFMRFINEVLPPDSRADLLGGVMVYKSTNPPAIGTIRAEEKVVLDYIYGLRNGYTHQGKAWGGVHPSLMPSIPDISDVVWHSREQWFDASYWYTANVNDWLPRLERVVRAGVAAHIARLLAR